MKDRSKETAITNKMRSLENEIKGLERKIDSETNPDNKRALERELDQAKRDLIEAESELVRLVMDAESYQ